MAFIQHPRIRPQTLRKLDRTMGPRCYAECARAGELGGSKVERAPLVLLAPAARRAPRARRDRLRPRARWRPPGRRAGRRAVRPSRACRRVLMHRAERLYRRAAAPRRACHLRFPRELARRRCRRRPSLREPVLHGGLCTVPARPRQLLPESRRLPAAEQAQAMRGPRAQQSRGGAGRD
jgi:hypothetical protein